MKKNILKIAFVTAIAMISGINVLNVQKSNVLSDIALANVEALAQDEADNWYCVGDYGFCFMDLEGVILGVYHSF